MKKLLIMYLFLLTIVFSQVCAQTVYWKKIANFDVSDIKVNSNGDIFICYNGIHKSTDKGKTWIKVNAPNYNFVKLVINDSNYIFAAADNANFYKSTDNGGSWININISQSPIISLHISRTEVIYAGNNSGEVFSSSDNGNTWSSAVVTNKPINCISTCTTGQVFSCTFNGIFSSTNQGNSWFLVDSVYKDASSIAINDSNFIFIFVGYDVYISRDLGATWTGTQHVPSNRNGLLLIDSSGAVMRAIDKIYKSTNNGSSWILLGNIYYINSIEFDGSKIYLASNSGLYRYDPDYVLSASNYFPLNTGNKWQYLYHWGIYTSSYNLDTISVLSDTVIEGNRYFRVNIFPDPIRYSESEKKLYLRWNNNDYLHIDFNIMPEGTYQAFSTNHTYEDFTALGGEKYIFGKERVFGGFFYFPFRGYVRMEFSDSIGITSQLVDNYYSIYGINILQAVIYDSLNNPVFITDHNKPVIVLQQKNTIDTLVFNLTFQVNHHFSRTGSGFNFIDSVYLEYFYFKEENTELPYYVNAVNTPQALNIYSVSIPVDTSLLKNGYIIKYRIIATDKGLIRESTVSPDSDYYQCVWQEPVGSIRTEGSVPSKYNLFQNYPNPFNPITEIKYSLPERIYVTLRIFDALGREIKTLVDEEKPAGNYTVDFNASGLSSGIYFYRIQTGEFIETKKMIVLK